MDVHDKLDELTAVLEDARSMPMSASCIVNRAELLALVDEIRALLPEELAHADLLLQEREAILAESRQEAQKIVDAAYDEQDRLVSETDVVREATERAAEERRAAAEEAHALRTEVDDYVDTKLANFEVVLSRTLAAVQRGRDALRRPGEDEFGDDDGDDLADDAGDVRREPGDRDDGQAYAAGAADWDDGDEPRPRPPRVVGRHRRRPPP